MNAPFLCSILIDITAVSFKGVLIYGTAELDYEGVVSKRIATFMKPLSQEEAETHTVRLSSKW
jgi:hypothetical protein